MTATSEPGLPRTLSHSLLLWLCSVIPFCLAQTCLVHIQEPVTAITGLILVSMGWTLLCVLAGSQRLPGHWQLTLAAAGMLLAQLVIGAPLLAQGLYSAFALLIMPLLSYLYRQFDGIYQQSPRYHLQTLLTYRPLLQIWFRYQIEARYRQTWLGLLWVIIQPVLTALVMSFVFMTLLGVRQMTVPFVSFLLSGKILFGIFNDIVQSSRGTFQRRIQLMKQVYFPREILILVALGQALVDFVLMLITLTVINGVFFGIYPTPAWLYLPVPLGLMIGLTLGTTLLISWLSLLVRDLQQLIGVVMQLLFYITVLYSPQIAPEPYVTWLAWNPLVPVLVAFRDIVLHGIAPAWTALYWPTGLMLLTLLAGYTVFKTHERKMIDIL